jgi:hypothetical protein
MCIPPIVVRQLLSKHISAAMNIETAIERLLDMSGGGIDGVNTSPTLIVAGGFTR